MKQPLKNKKIWVISGLLAAAVLIGAVIWLIVRFYPVIQSLAQPENMERFRQKLDSYGAMGAAILTGLQILQVISGIIPALPIQLGAGVTYGAVGGLAICLTGILAGSSLVFLTVKRFGQPLVDKVFPKEKQEKLAFLQDADQLGLIVFIIYLIPAMPKDVLTYVAALTPISFRRFLALSMVARIPTILCNTFASNALLNGNYQTSIIVFCITGTLGLLCMVFSKRILDLLKQLKRH